MGHSRSRNRRGLRVLAIALAVALVTGGLSFLGLTGSSFGKRLELSSINQRFELRGERAAPRDIVIVEINEQTDYQLKASWPYPRAVHGEVVRNLAKAGVAATAFDVQFWQPDPRGGNDFALAQAIRTNPPVILATAPEARSDRTLLPIPLQSKNPAPDGTSLFRWSGARIGLTQLEVEADGSRRRILTHSRFTLDNEPIEHPSLAVAGLAAAEGISTHDFAGMPEVLDLNFYSAGQEQRFRRINFADVAQGKGLKGLKGALVFVGATGAAWQDIHETPITAQMAGVEIHATAAANIRDRSWLTVWGDGSALLFAFILVLAICVVMTLLNTVAALPLAVTILAAYAGFAQLRFNDNEVLPLIGPLGAGAAVLTALTAYHAVSALRDRRRVASLFARYVSPAVVSELVASGDLDARLGGERREITVLFSDIRGFTSLSEHADAAEMVAELNEYFAEMTDAVEAQDGTVDKFMGDGLMAMFGAPLDQPDHAERACRVALDMLERLRWLNSERQARGLVPLNIGIGLNTGYAVVGNIGSSRRTEFTAIGDAVNLASRIESATKDVGVGILVSQSTVEAAPSHIFAPKGSIVAKGRTQATAVYELRTEAEQPIDTTRPADTAA